MAGALLVLL